MCSIILKALFVIGLFKYGLGIPPSSRKTIQINGGDHVDIKDAPYMVFILVHVGESGFNCDGTIISPNHVLTAGHCVTSTVKDHPHPKVVEAKNFTLLVGTPDMTNMHHDGLTFGVDKVFFKEDTIRNDIAILKLNASIPITDKTKPIALPTDSNYVPAHGTKTFVDGWGDTPRQTVMLIRAEVNVFVGDTCTQRFDDPKYHICTTGDKGTGPCYGDNGGPLLLPNGTDGKDLVQIGIISILADHCTNEVRDPTVYTSVAANLEWIKSVLSEEEDEISVTLLSSDHDSDGRSKGEVAVPYSI